MPTAPPVMESGSAISTSKLFDRSGDKAARRDQAVATRGQVGSSTNDREGCEAKSS